MRDVIRTIAIAALAALTSLPRAHAQVYPSRPITMNVPYAAGGPLDVMVRVVADGLRAALGQAIVIENVAGAGGSLTAIRSAPATGVRTSQTAPSTPCRMICAATSSRCRCFPTRPT
jgi:tripartite-type tricarboxylate transporter receptor subunit TctC